MKGIKNNIDVTYNSSVLTKALEDILNVTEVRTEGTSGDYFE